MRIAIFSDSALPILNGVSVSVDALVRGLRDAGHSVHLFCARYPGHREHDPNVYRFRALETPWTKGFPLAYPPFYRTLRRFRRHKFDVVHAHTIGIVSFVGMRWAESHDIPVVATYHTLYDRYAHYIPLVPRRYVRWKIAKHTNFFYNRVAHVITPSEAALKWLRRHAVDTPATVIPTGAPPLRFLDRAETRQELGIAPDQRILLYVGRLAIEKNLGTLFRAAGRIFEREPRARLWIVGDGPYRAECTQIVRELGLGDRVRFVGFVPRSEVDRYYVASDLFLFSSITETQGLVVQEAMGYGLPPVTVAGGGASEGIVDGESGFVLRNDPEALADSALRLLRDDDLYSRVSDSARRSVRAHRSEDMVNAVVEVYRDAITQHEPMEAPKLARLF